MNELSHPAMRIAGVILAAAIIFVLDLSNATALHQLWLPLGLALAAYAMTQSLMAVAFASCTLSLIHLDLAASWPRSWGYATVAAVSAVTMMVIMGQRFRERIKETHAARWAHRQHQQETNNDPAD